MRCVKCGHESNKQKLTLSIDKELIDKAKSKGINLSELMEKTLTNLLKRSVEKKEELTRKKR